MPEQKSYQLNDCWILLKKGDPSALGYLYDTYSDKLFAAAMRLTRDREMAKDALQEVFIELWNYRETLGTIEHSQSYLVKVMRSILLKKLKKENAFGLFYLPAVDGIIDDEMNMEDRLISRDSDREKDLHLQHALSTLTSRQKEILDLRFNHGLSYNQIAHKLGMNYQSVNNLVFRTIVRLRIELSAVLCLFILV